MSRAAFAGTGLVAAILWGIYEGAGLLGADTLIALFPLRGVVGILFEVVTGVLFAAAAGLAVLKWRTGTRVGILVGAGAVVVIALVPGILWGAGVLGDGRWAPGKTLTFC